MPFANGFEISIEGVDGTPFTTYGTRSKGKTVYTYIEAKDGIRFTIRVKPEAPFPEPRDVTDGSERSGKSRYSLRSSMRQDEAQDAMDCDESDTFLKPKQPYDYFAYVYIDGSKEAENNALIPTSPDARWYNADGYVFRGRLCLADDAPSDSGSKSDLSANFIIFPWTFTKKGIDVLLSYMNISKADADIPSSDLEQDLADLTHDFLSKPAGGKRGQIEIVIRRMVCGKKVRPGAHWKRGEGVISGDDDDNSHYVTVDLDNEERIRHSSVQTHRYRSDEEWFSKVVIQYHNVAKLVNLGLCTRDGKPVEHRQLRALPTLPSSSESQDNSLKRLRDPESRKSESDESRLDKSISNDEEESASDTTSDSDVPHRKSRRRAVTFRKCKVTPRKKSKKLGWKVQKATEVPSKSLPLPIFEVDGKGAGWLQLELRPKEKAPRLPTTSCQLVKADDQTNNDIAAGNMELVQVDQSEVVEISDEEREA